MTYWMYQQHKGDLWQQVWSLRLQNLSTILGTLTKPWIAVTVYGLLPPQPLPLHAMLIPNNVYKLNLNSTAVTLTKGGGGETCVQRVRHSSAKNLFLLGEP